MRTVPLIFAFRFIYYLLFFLLFLPLKIKSSVTVPPEIRSIASRRMNIPSLPVLGLVDFVSVAFEVDLSFSAFVFLSPYKITLVVFD